MATKILSEQGATITTAPQQFLALGVDHWVTFIISGDFGTSRTLDLKVGGFADPDDQFVSIFDGGPITAAGVYSAPFSRLCYLVAAVAGADGGSPAITVTVV